MANKQPQPAKTRQTENLHNLRRETCWTILPAAVIVWLAIAGMVHLQLLDDTHSHISRGFGVITPLFGSLLFVICLRLIFHYRTARQIKAGKRPARNGDWWAGTTLLAALLTILAGMAISLLVFIAQIGILSIFWTHHGPPW